MGRQLDRRKGSSSITMGHCESDTRLGGGGPSMEMMTLDGRMRPKVENQTQRIRHRILGVFRAEFPRWTTRGDKGC